MTHDYSSIDSSIQGSMIESARKFIPFVVAASLYLSSLHSLCLFYIAFLLISMSSMLSGLSHILGWVIS